jgi:hypothetical protein
MKLKSYIIAGMAAMMLSACNEDFGDWVIPAGNEQAAIHSFGDGSVSAADPIMFADLAEDVAAVKVANITAPKADSVFATSYQIQLGKDLHELMADGMMSRTELENYVLATFGPRPVERELTANVIATVSNGKTATRYTNPLTIKATPKAPFIDAAYYLAGDMTGWDAESAVAFAHSGKDVYEDPVFTIVVKTTEANQYWKIIPKTNYDGEFWAEGEKGVVGVANDGDDAPSGSLTTNNPGAGKIANVGYHKITINMMEYTYTVEDLNFAEFIYEVGNNTSWAEHPYAMYGPNFDGKYYGAFYLDGEFKFKPNGGDDWSGDWEYNGEGKLTADGSENISAPETGFYFVTVDLASMSYALKPFEEMHVVGDALVGNADQWGAGVTMTWNATNKTWEAKGVKLEAGKTIKFKDEDDSWSGVNLGGTLDKLIQGSMDNIPVAQSGTFDIILHLENTDRAPYAELIAK